MHSCVAVTAEPFGAYHLRPLVSEATRRGVDVTHLLPYPSPPQGTAFPVASDLGVLDTAGVVLLSGGGLTPWTETIARDASAAKTPFVHVELAYGVDRPHPRPLRDAAAIVAASSSSAAAAASHLGVPVSAVTVVGDPALDDLPLWAPEPGTVLAVTTVSNETPDGGRALEEALDEIAAAGWRVVVRPHPREDRARWERFELDGSPDATTALAGAAVLFGYAGTVFVRAAAMRVPIVALATEAWMTARAPAAHLGVASRCAAIADAAEAVAGAVPASDAATEEACGPVGGAAARIWDEVSAAAGWSLRAAA